MILVDGPSVDRLVRTSPLAPEALQARGPSHQHAEATGGLRRGSRKTSTAPGPSPARARESGDPRPQPKATWTPGRSEAIDSQGTHRAPTVAAQGRRPSSTQEGHRANGHETEPSSGR